MTDTSVNLRDAASVADQLGDYYSDVSAGAIGHVTGVAEHVGYGIMAAVGYEVLSNQITSLPNPTPAAIAARTTLVQTNVAAIGAIAAYSGVMQFGAYVSYGIADFLEFAADILESDASAPLGPDGDIDHDYGPAAPATHGSSTASGRSENDFNSQGARDAYVDSISPESNPHGMPYLPIIIDLDGDGVEISLQFGLATFFDLDDDGYLERTAWVASDDAFLVVDVGADGLIDQAREIAFTEWLDPAEREGHTDLSALAEVFDSNDDGVFDAEDDRWDEFRVWQDIDQDGEVDHDAGELRTLDGRRVNADGSINAEADEGATIIESINLTYNDSAAFGDTSDDITIFGNTLHGTASFSGFNADGEAITQDVGDVSLSYFERGYREVETEDGFRIEFEGGDELSYRVMDGTGAADVDLDAAFLDGVFGDERDNELDATGMIVGAVLQGGDGDDQLLGGTGNDLISGDAGADVLRGRGGHDTIVFDADDTVVHGGGGYDVGIVSEGAVTLALDETLFEAAFGGDGNDTFSVASDHVVAVSLHGGGGNDTLSGGRAGDILSGGDGNDDLNGHGSGDTLLGGSGDDRLDGGDGDDYAFGGDNNDTLFGRDGDDFLFGGDHHDALSGGDGDDNLFGGRHRDTLIGGHGDDRLFGEHGHDTLQGGNDDDYLSGGSHDDTLMGGNQDDILDGGEGNDVLYAGAGHDQMFGGEGDDSFYLTDGPDDTTPSAEGIERISGGEGNDILYLDVDLADITFHAILIHFGIRHDTRTVLQVAARDQWLEVEGIEELHFSDGTTLQLTDEDGEIDYGVADFNNSLEMPEQELHGETYRRSGSYVVWRNPDNDALRGFEGNDLITGGGGDDLVIGHSGSDVLFGDVDSRLRLSYQAQEGGGDDRFAVTRSAHVGTTSYGDDTIRGHSGSDYINGGRGADTLDGGHGADTIFGDGQLASTEDANTQVGFDDTIIGDSGADSLFGGYGEDTIHGGSGADFIDGGDGFDWLYGDDGDDLIYGGEGQDRLYGLDDDDVLDGGRSDDILNGGFGNDRLSGGQGHDKLIGGAGNDTLNGGRNRDELHGSDGSDALYGDHGFDLLLGGEDDDFLSGGEGNDTLYGNQGADYLEGGLGADILDGSSTTLADGTVVDRGDRDVASYINAEEGVAVSLATGTGTQGEADGDTLISIEDLVGSGHDDTLSGDDNRNILWGNGGNDNLSGNGGDDYLYGEDGNDDIVGHAGRDRLFGGDGDDDLSGGSGDDHLTGGEGADTFIFNVNNGTDVITDFEVGIDTIHIRDDAVTGYADLTLTEDEDDVLVSFETTTVRLRHTDLNQVSEADFQFGTA